MDVERRRLAETRSENVPGWTGVVARGMHVFATSTGPEFLELGKVAAIVEVEQRPRGRSASRTARR
jgi:hypothetical protein